MGKPVSGTAPRPTAVTLPHPGQIVLKDTHSLQLRRPSALFVRQDHPTSKGIRVARYLHYIKELGQGQEQSARLSAAAAPIVLRAQIKYEKHKLCGKTTALWRVEI